MGNEGERERVARIVQNLLQFVCDSVEFNGFEATSIGISQQPQSDRTHDRIKPLKRGFL